jgi:branched-chain amino acid transport system ATP-binding protein
LFDDLTVVENLTVAADRPRPLELVKQLFTSSVKRHPAVDEALEMFGIADLAGATPSELTQGQRKLVGVARAVAARPKVLLLDEPAAGLDARESKELGRHLRQVVDSGLPILLVDHDMGLVLDICDNIVVIEFGQVIGRGTPAEIRKDPNVVAAYLGSSAGELGEAGG